MEFVLIPGKRRNRSGVVAAATGPKEHGSPEQKGNALHGFRPLETKQPMPSNMGQESARANFEKARRGPLDSVQPDALTQSAWPP